MIAHDQVSTRRTLLLFAFFSFFGGALADDALSAYMNGTSRWQFHLILAFAACVMAAAEVRTLWNRSQI